MAASTLFDSLLQCCESFSRTAVDPHAQLTRLSPLLTPADIARRPPTRAPGLVHVAAARLGQSRG